MRRRLGVEAPAQRPRQQTVQRLASSSSAPSVGERGLAGERRREPIRRRCGERRVGEVGPFVALRRRAGTCTRSRHCAQRLASTAADRCRARAMPCGEHPRRVVVRHDLASAVPTSAIAPSRRLRRPRRLALASSNTISSRLSMRSANRASISASADRRREHDAALRGGAGDFGDREKRLARQRATPDRHWRRGRWRAGTRRPRRDSSRCGPDRRARAARRC